MVLELLWNWCLHTVNGAHLFTQHGITLWLWPDWNIRFLVAKTVGFCALLLRDSYLTLLRVNCWLSQRLNHSGYNLSLWFLGSRLW